MKSSDAELLVATAHVLHRDAIDGNRFIVAQICRGERERERVARLSSRVPIFRLLFFPGFSISHPRNFPIRHLRWRRAKFSIHFSPFLSLPPSLLSFSLLFFSLLFFMEQDRGEIITDARPNGAFHHRCTRCSRLIYRDAQIQRNGVQT